ncbi:MAG: prolipoprotein diacylglyceryl transferase [Anaerolineae bacterium]
MPSLYTQIGPWRLQTFTLAVTVVILLSLMMVIRRRQPRAPLVDACLGALVGGVLVARLFHVLLNWDYFADNLTEARTIGAGGLDWHGAVLGGMIGLGAVIWARKRYVLSLQHFSESTTVRFNVLLDWLTPALPLIGLGAWYGCLAAGCGYGREVDTLANFPWWAASEYVDVFGIVLPRLNTPYFGMVLCICGLVLVGLSGMWRKWRAGQSNLPTLPALRPPVRFWFMVALLSAGMFLIGFMRDDHTFYWYSLRADQILDIIMMLWGLAVVGYQRSGLQIVGKQRRDDEQTA